MKKKDKIWNIILFTIIAIAVIILIWATIPSKAETIDIVSEQLIKVKGGTMLGAFLGIGIVGVIFSVIQIGQVLLWKWFAKHKQAREFLRAIGIEIKLGGKHAKKKD